MKKQLPLFGVFYIGKTGTLCMQPVKAETKASAVEKFKKKYPYNAKTVRATVAEIPPTNSLFRMFKSQAI